MGVPRFYILTGSPDCEYQKIIAEIKTLIEDDKDVSDKVDSLLESVFEDGIYEVQHASDYAEPGYSCEEKGVLFANWNVSQRWDTENNKWITLDDFLSSLSEVVEAAGYEIEWSDEWTTCGECGLAVRTRGDSYSWRGFYHIIDCEVTCGECIQEDPTEYLEDISGNPRKAVTFDIDLEKHGYSKLELDLQHGLYGGQDDNPDKIAQALDNAGIEDYVFSIDSVGQFDMRFSVYVKHDSLSAATRVVKNEDTKCDIDPATNMERGLKAASKAMSTLPKGPGVQVAKIGDNGAVTVRLVSPEDFIAGKALD